MGMALAVAWVVPFLARTYSWLGSPLVPKTCLAAHWVTKAALSRSGSSGTGPSTPTTPKLVLLSRMVRISPGR